MKHVALIPAFNEEETIREVIIHIKKYPHIDIIVVDDGSNDRTAEIAKKMGAIVLQHKTNKGKGEAIKTGFNYILKKHKAQYTVLIDADMQYHPSESVKLLKILENNEADFVMGIRDPRNVPYANRMGNFIWRTFFNSLFGAHFRDTNCGYMALNRRAIEKVKNIHGGYIIENAILRDVIKNKLRYKQIYVKVRYGKRKIRKFAKMFFGIWIFILWEGFKYRLGVK